MNWFSGFDYLSNNTPLIFSFVCVAKELKLMDEESFESVVDYLDSEHELQRYFFGIG